MPDPLRTHAGYLFTPLRLAGQKYLDGLPVIALNPEVSVISIASIVIQISRNAKHRKIIGDRSCIKAFLRGCPVFGGLNQFFSACPPASTATLNVDMMATAADGTSLII